MNSFDQEKQIAFSEERVIHRVSIKRILASVVDAFSLDRGLVFTLRRLFTEPGKLTQDYLYKGRYHYTPPFRMLFISTTIVVLLLSYSRSGLDIFQLDPKAATTEQAKMIQDILAEYYNLFLWLFIPVLGLFSWLFNRRSKYNYAENVVLQTYLMIIGNLLYAVMLFEYFIPANILSGAYMIVSFSYNVYAYKQFFEKSWGRSILEVIAILLLSILVYGIISAFGIGVYVGYNQAAGG